MICMHLCIEYNQLNLILLVLKCLLYIWYVHVHVHAYVHYTFVKCNICVLLVSELILYLSLILVFV